MKNRKTILLVANWDSNVGYAWWLMESFWAKIAEEFSTQYRVVICYPSISTLPDSIAKSNAEKISFDFNRRGFSAFISQCKFIGENNVRHIYFTDQPPTRLAYLFYRLAGVQKLVTHDHTPGLRTKPTGIKRLLKIIKTHIPFVNADLFLGATDFVRERLVDVNCLPEKKCFAINNGIPLPATEDLPLVNIRDSFKIPQNAFVVVTTSRAHKYKGIEFAIDVLSNTEKTEPNNNIYYVFLGDGPHLEDFKNHAIKMNVEKKVKFGGKIDNVRQMISQANIAFHPSYGEVGYSLSILEYMLEGLPLLVSDNPSVCGATEDGITGLIYQEHNYDNATQKLLEFYRNPQQTQAMGLKSKQRVLEKFSLQKTHETLIKTLRTIF